jgi:hypothetical protein
MVLVVEDDEALRAITERIRTGGGAERRPVTRRLSSRWRPSFRPAKNQGCCDG